LGAGREDANTLKRKCRDWGGGAAGPGDLDGGTAWVPSSPHAEKPDGSVAVKVFRPELCMPS